MSCMAHRIQLAINRINHRSETNKEQYNVLEVSHGLVAIAAIIRQITGTKIAQQGRNFHFFKIGSLIG